MKNQSLISKIVSPFVLAGSLIATNPDSKAEDYHPGYHHNHHSHFGGYYFFDPFQTRFSFEPYHHGYHHDDSFPHLGLHIIDGTLNFLLYSQLIEESRARNNYYKERYYNERARDSTDRRDNRYRIEDPSSIPQTFTANYWKDSDGNGLKRIDEMEGLNRKTFRVNEHLTYGMHLPITGIRGKEYGIRLVDKKGNLVHFTRGRFDENNQTLNVSWKPSSLSKIVNSHGEGLYSAEFYLDGRQWNKKEFNLVNSQARDQKKSDSNLPDNFLCRWEDSDKNGRFDYNELKDIGKIKFAERERISFFSKSDKSNQTYEVKIFNKTDELVKSWKSSNEYGEVLFYDNTLKPGSYYAVFKVDGKYRDDISFEVALNPKKPDKQDKPKPSLEYQTGR